MVGSISNLLDVTERFDQAVSQTVAAARGLSEPGGAAPDLPSAIVELSKSEKAVNAIMATVRVSKEMDAAVLNIVA